MLLRSLLMLVLFVLLVSITAAGGVQGRGGFEAVAVSPDGKVIAVGGQNRVVYLVDAETLAVRQRIWHGKRIGNLAFGKTSAALLIEDETDTLTLLDVATNKLVVFRSEVSDLVVHPGTGRLVIRDMRELAQNRLLVCGIEDLALKGQIDLPDRAVTWSFTEAGDRLVLLGSSKASDREPLAIPEIPPDLRGLERAIFRLKNDDQAADLVELDLATTRTARRTRLWYSSDTDTTRLVRTGDRTFIYNRVNLCARVNADGKKIEVFETDQTLNHAIGLSANGKWLALGGLAGGSIGLLDGGKRIPFALPPLPGQDELVSRLVVEADGGGWGVTTAFRLFRFEADGSVKRIAPIY